MDPTAPSATPPRRRAWLSAPHTAVGQALVSALAGAGVGQSDEPAGCAYWVVWAPDVPRWAAPAAAPSGLEAVVLLGAAAASSGAGTPDDAVIHGAIPPLARALARRLAPTVRVNALLTGWLEGELKPEEAVARRIPMARGGRPAEAAELILYLLAQADFVTGAVLNLDGGWLL